MDIICIGEDDFCDMFAITGTECFTCMSPDEAVRIISDRGNRDEIIFISETIASYRDRGLEELMNDPERIIIPLPSASSVPDNTTTGTILGAISGETWD